MKTPEDFKRERRERASMEQKVKAEEQETKAAQRKLGEVKKQDTSYESKEYRTDRFILGKDNSLKELEGAEFVMDFLGERVPDKNGKLLGVMEYGIQAFKKNNDQKVDVGDMNEVAAAMRRSAIDYIDGAVSKNLYFVNKNDQLDPIRIGGFNVSVFHNPSDKITSQLSDNRSREVRDIAVKNRITLSFDDDSGKKPDDDAWRIILDSDGSIRIGASEKVLSSLSGSEALKVFEHASEKIISSRDRVRDAAENKKEKVRGIREAA